MCKPNLRSEKRFQQDVNLRKVRDFHATYIRYLWDMVRDDYDFFDLRYLFDEEEVREAKQQLIDEIEGIRSNPHHEYEDYNNLEEDDWNLVVAIENYEMLFGNEEEKEQKQNIVEEDWDNDEYDVRFEMRLGFITDDYDSGYDEPYTRKEDFPPYYEIESEDEKAVNHHLAEMLVQLHLRKNRVADANS